MAKSKTKGWLDSYQEGGVESTQAGYTDIPFRYNSAWGGQFAMGGSIPGSVGFTYARTHSPAPSEGPYAKKTLPSAQNGQEMRYYQEGLDWKPKSISKNGGWLDKYIPEAQGGLSIPGVTDFKPMGNASESTSIVRNTPKGQVSTSTTGATKQQMKEQSDAMMRQTKREEEEKKARIAERKSAVASRDKNKPFTFPTGETKTYDQMDWREKNYVAGKALEQRGRFNENDETFFDEWINPINLIGSTAGAIGTAPYEAKQFDSNLPYVGAIAGPLITGALGFDPLGGAMKVPGKVAQSMESGVLSNMHKVNPFAGTFAGESKLPNFLQFNKLDDPNAFWRLTKDPKNFGLAEGAYFNKGVPLTKELAETFPKGSRASTHRYSGPKWNPKTGKMDLYDGSDYLFKVGDEKFMEPHLSFPEPHLKFYRQSGNIPEGQSQMFKKDWLQGWKEVPKPASAYEDYFRNIKANDKRLQDLLSSKKITYDDYLKQQELYEQELHKGLGLGEKLGSGKYGSVFELGNDPSKVVKLGRPYGNKWTPELIESLKSVNQNANIAIPEKVQYFEIPSQWKGYGPTTQEVVTMPNLNKTAAEKLNLSKRDRYAYFLKQARQLRDKGIMLDVENFDNFKFNQSKNVFDIYDVNPGNIDNPAAYMRYIKNKTQKRFLDNMMYKKGGVIKDDRGQWAHPGEITEIGSNRITMQGVPYPVLGISDQGDTQIMFPGEEYKFKGKKVTEIPIAQKGKILPPIYTDDPRKVQDYSDSLALFNASNQARVNNLLRQGYMYDTDKGKKENYKLTNKEKKEYQKSYEVNPKKRLQKIIQSGNDGKIDTDLGGKDDKKAQYELMHGNIAPVAIAPLVDSWWRSSPYLYEHNGLTLPGSTFDKDKPGFRKNPNYGKPYAKDKDNNVLRNFFGVPIYQEPVQPYILQQKPQLDDVGNVQIQNVTGARPMSTNISVDERHVGTMPSMPQGNYMVGYFDENNQGVDRGFMTPEERDAFVEELRKRDLSSVQPSTGNITQYYRLPKKENKKETGGWLNQYK